MRYSRLRDLLTVIPADAGIQRNPEDYLHLFCLLLGEITGVAWLVVMCGQQGTSAASWLVWFVLLAGSLTVGSPPLCAVTLQVRAFRKEIEPDPEQPT